MIRFNLVPLLQGEMRISKFKSTYNSLILVLEFCNVTFFKVKGGQPNLKVLITHLLLVLVVCIVEPTYRKLFARNLLMWLDLTLGPSFKFKRGQPKLKVLITCLLLVLEVCIVKPIFRKSWARNLPKCLDLILGLSFKVKQG